MPDIKEKLVALLMQKGFGVEGATIAAGHLIANGVTFKTEPQTNADRIRAMSDEELAYLLTTGHGNFDCSVCEIGDQRKCDMECGERCLAWLQQPAEEVHHD